METNLANVAVIDGGCGWWHVSGAPIRGSSADAWCFCLRADVRDGETSALMSAWVDGVLNYFPAFQWISAERGSIAKLRDADVYEAWIASFGGDMVALALALRADAGITIERNAACGFNPDGSLIGDEDSDCDSD